MFWIALSLMIMNLTGEGDDTYAFREFLEEVRESVEENVHDQGRQRTAVQAVDRASDAFTKHRNRVGKISECIERADRKYVVTEAEYERCLVDLGPAWDAAGEDLIELERAFRSALTPQEQAAVRRGVE